MSPIAKRDNPPSFKIPPAVTLIAEKKSKISPRLNIPRDKEIINHGGESSPPLSKELILDAR